ncbi:GNAT family N-acetyltransferase [Yoonia maritima]|uniref:GNAT family N-acetyltransferase n=1 Tax=Yoonia maritima TaxID=1435347 RepID=UPI001EF7DA00|nr:GNAT family N-acetyltransferase [Yoonia maritima]
MTPMFRTSTQAEIYTMLDWAAAEGWNPGIDDASVFFQTDMHGFFVAELDGAIVAAISVVNHNDDMAFLGLYLCGPMYRGKGIGYGLWKYALAHAGPRTVGLDGVKEQQANYARSGFTLAGASTRMQGCIPQVLTDDIRPINYELDVEVITQLDGAANGYARDAFLSGWTNDTDERKTLVYETNGTVTGFATIRRCKSGHKVGPVIAPNSDIALKLLSAAAKHMSAHQVIIDMTDGQPQFKDQLITFGFEPIFETARMYRGTPPKKNATLFAIATMELG